MQEQPLYNITPEQGWSKMRPVLDQEMPVNRRTRRFGLFWWTASAVAVFSTLGLFLITDNMALPQNKPLENQVVPAPVNSQPATMQNTIAAVDAGLQNNNDQSIIISESQNFLSGEPNSVNHDGTLSGTSKPVIENKAAKSSIGKSMVEADPKTASIATIINTVAEPLPAALVNKDIQTAAEEASSTQMRNGQVIEVLPVFYAEAIVQEHSREAMLPISPAKVQRTFPLLEPSLAVSGLAGQNGGLGAYGGVGLNLNLSAKFTVTSGLGYQSYHPDATLFGALKEDYATQPESNAILNHDLNYEGIHTYLDGQFVNTTVGSNVISPFVDAIHQWQVSGGVKWKLHRRFFVESGVQLAFKTEAISTYPIISVDNNSTVNNVRIGNSFNSYDVVRSTMTSLYLGLGYRIGNHFDVFTQWTHGLEPYLLNDISGTLPPPDLNTEDGRTDYIRGLSLGLRYTF